MKSRSFLFLFLLVFLVLSLALVPSAQLALAASTSSTKSTTTSSTSTASTPKSPYSEKLDIYTAGSNDYWRITLSPVNASSTAIVAAESVSGMSAYELTAVKTTAANPSSQLFWADGYKVVKLPFMPDVGAFLNVTASSVSAAQSAATAFNSLLGANFVQIGSPSGSNYTFFSPAAFATASATMFASVPSANGGLATFTSATTLASQPAPTMILTGVRSGSSFTHAVAFGSTETGIMTNGSLNLASAMNKPNATIKSSPAATSTQVFVHSLDGLIVSKDAEATITNNQGTFSGTYSVSTPSNSRIFPNVTLLQDPPLLSASRLLDKGSAVSGNLVSVTLSFRNTGLTGTIQNIAVNDSWWRAYPTLLAVSAGNWSFTLPSLAAGQNISRAYVLKVTSSAVQDLTIPAASVSYSYSVNGVTVNLGTATNQDELRTNNIGPALIIHAATDIRSGQALGTAGHYIVTVTNIGDGPALNLQVGNFTNPTLTQAGGVWKFNTTLPITSIVGRNLTQTFTVGWTAPDGSRGTLVSNPTYLLLSHSGILVPFMRFTLAATLTPAVINLGSANATYTLVNAGNLATTSVNVTQAFPTGMACKSVLIGAAKCTSSGFSVSVGTLATGADVKGTLVITFSNDNYLIQPAFITATESGLTLHNAGAAFIVPAGVVVTKTYATNPVFQSQNDTVTVQVVNKGTVPVFNMSVSAQADAFDKALSGTLHNTYGTLGPSSTQSFNYTVQMLTPGNHTTAATSVAFTLGGSLQSNAFPSGNIVVYKLVQATAATAPSVPVEGSIFVLTVNVQNPSSVDVTSVSVSFPIPQGLAIVNASSGVDVKGHNITLSLPSLAAGASSSRSVTLRASTDGSINLGSGTLTFQYQGSTIRGLVSTPAVNIAIDLLVRYELPIGGAVLLTIAIAVYMHRKLSIPQAK